MKQLEYLGQSSILEYLGQSSILEYLGQSSILEYLGQSSMQNWWDEFVCLAVRELLWYLVV